MKQTGTDVPQSFYLHGLNGISDRSIDMHVKL